MASRTELLAWVNDLLQINYTKIEQLGGGGAFCQIINTIYGASTAPRAHFHCPCVSLAGADTEIPYAQATCRWYG
jgi:hypothetical protein